MVGKPRGGVAGEALFIGEPNIVLDSLLAVVRDCVTEFIVAGERWVLLLIFRQATQATKRERLDHCLLEPLALAPWLRVRLPAISQNVTELVAELIGEFGPIPVANIDYNPGHAATIGMQPDGRRSRSMLVDTQPRWLAVGEKTDAIETCMPHALDDNVPIVGDHMTPITRELYGSRK
jgi:hypothetical protein